jgi:hypothetical protein
VDREAAMATAAQDRLSDGLIDEIAGRLAAGQRVRRTLPPGGRLHIDRQLPFLFVYRPPAAGIDPGVAGFITGEASYLITPRPQRGPALDRPAGGAHHGGPLRRLRRRFLMVEIWTSTEPAGNSIDPPTASFRVVVDKGWANSPTVERLAESLGAIRVHKRKSKVVVSPAPRPSPPGLAPLLAPRTARDLSIRSIGIEVAPIHRDAETGTEFPLLQRSLARQLDIALRRTAFEFARSETASRPLHYHALGRRTFVRAVRDADRAFSTIADSFDLLLAVTPVNAEQAYRAFQRSRYEKPPQFRYRPRTADPTALKRALWATSRSSGSRTPHWRRSSGRSSVSWT